MLTPYFYYIGTSLVVQWLRSHAGNAGGMGTILGWRTKSPHAAWYSQKGKIIITKKNVSSMLPRTCWAYMKFACQRAFFLKSIRSQLVYPQKWPQANNHALGFSFLRCGSLHRHPLEKEMATHLSIIAQRIPQTDDPGRLQSMGSQRVGQD